MTNPHLISTAPLSPAGRARQGQILLAMQRAGRARRRRRHLAQAAAAVAPLLLVAAAAAWLRPGAPAAPAPIAAPGPVPTPVPAVRLAYSEFDTDPTVLDRYAFTAPEPTTVVYIGDRELSGELARAGLDPGIIRTPDRVYILALNDLAPPPLQH
jgi:hypothetical protein